MVTRLDGKVNGQSIAFTRKMGDTWECVFPIQGHYDAIIELTAYDEAGNFCYKTCYLLTFDPDSLYMRLVPVDYWLEPMLEETVLCCVEPVDFAVQSMPDNVYLKYQAGGEELRMLG